MTCEGWGDASSGLFRTFAVWGLYHAAVDLWRLVSFVRDMVRERKERRL